MRDDLNAHYVLTADIDATATATWNEDPENPGFFLGFDPVGDSTWALRFRGSLDGQGHLIVGLHVNRPAESRTGLFGYLSEEAVVKNLGLVDAQVAGGQRTGILAGENHGSISKVFTTGQVSGAWATGGLVGENHRKGVIENAYSHAKVLISNYGGGLVGSNQGTIRWAFSTGVVSGPQWAAGGLVGQINNHSAVTDAYWDMQTSGLATSGAGGGKTTDELLSILSYQDWDLSTPEDHNGQTWILLPGEDYPTFGWQSPPPSPVVTISGAFSVYDKLQDGTEAAVISENSLTLVGVAPGDDVRLEVEVRFAGTEKGTQQVILSETTRLVGADAHNYQLSLEGAPTATAQILPLKIRLRPVPPPAMAEMASMGGPQGRMTAHPRVEWKVPSLPNPNGRVFLVQKATRLDEQDWQTVGTVEPETGELAWTSPEPANGNAFFRVVLANGTNQDDS